MMQAWHEQEQEKEEEDPTAEQAITGTDEELEKEEQSAEAILSLHATSSAKQAKTLQIPGKIRDLTVIALVDSGSTHSFLDPRIIKGQDYSITPTKPMLIEVANGGKMVSNSVCKEDMW